MGMESVPTTETDTFDYGYLVDSGDECEVEQDSEPRTNRHLVFVLPLHGPSLDDSYERQMQIPVANRVSATKQLAMALKGLHEAGIVHREKYQRFGRPRKVHLTEVKGRLGELVESMQFPRDMIRESVSLGDFGESIEAVDCVEKTIQFPLLYCAPERFHNISPGPPSDMWSYT
ncbi:uncharacterized protein BP5553_08474 [Venustampulla echinocandica]|uniref:Protein kinase domain-containing protein n=1 Tax=Venustampulla echinocandica TaxID=2656787 RepID=A0A370TEC0_9HELO|nr:uncharacterized protein BP5553_08474 [Venustampulla echinocandica]RDL33035.1 hypothetical protein BP5553_08474 [Venustampulla echinocandica]